MKNMSTAKSSIMKNSFGTRLKELRASQSQASVAAIFGVAQQTYAGWEKDQRKPNLLEICSICRHFSVSADWLLGLETSAPTSNPRAEMAEAKLNAVKKSLLALVKEL